jgi:glycosyltransferase involved in cell wall biosynthesis
VEIEPSGFYVLPEDAAGLRRAIAYLLERPDERRRLGEAGRRTVERLVTIEQFGERLRALIDEACAARTAGARDRAATGRLEVSG